MAATTALISSGLGDIDADLELAPLASCGPLLSSLATPLGEFAHDVPADESALLGVADQGRKRNAHLADHDLRSRLRRCAFRHVAAGELVLEGAHQGRRKLGELRPA